MKTVRAKFDSEAALCSAFITAATRPNRRKQPEWCAYPETGGFDILLSRIEDGLQIGIEAKLTLNETVIRQAMDTRGFASGVGPDYRAVLVPSGTARGLLEIISDFIGITVIECSNKTDDDDDYRRYSSGVFSPSLPMVGQDQSRYGIWHEMLPTKRLALPEYVPDVTAGRPSPIQLTAWKIGAMKISILMERNGFVTRADFKHVSIDHRRWVAEKWIIVQNGVWIRGPYWSDFRRQHPKNYEEIALDFDRWKPIIPPA